MYDAIEIAAKVVCIFFLIVQGGVLDVYLVKQHNTDWVAWIVADISVIILWIVSLVLAHRRFKISKMEVDAGRPPEERPDELRFAYVAWISYAALLTPRIVIAFGKNAQQLKEIYFFGPNTLKAAVACTPLIFLLLVYGHHDARPHSSRKFYIERLTGSVAFDLFDSMDLLEICFLNKEQRQFPDQITDACLAFACINLFLPTLALYELNFNKFNGAVTPLSFKIAYAASFVCLVNVPNLIIRSVLWHKYYTDVSVLLMKNVMCIVLGISDILESIGSERPQKCHKCGRTYSVHHFPQHVQGCTASVVMNL